MANSLEATGAARTLITVAGTSFSSTTAAVETWQRTASCWSKVGGSWPAFIGRNGFSDHRREGDGTTPTGIYRIGSVVYGNAPDPGVHVAFHRLVCGDWWDEDATSAQYNTFVHLPCGVPPPFGGNSEALWTETAVYPAFAVVDYNTHPAVPYAGSAIFVHAAVGVPTSGCVSLPVADLYQLLRWIPVGDSTAIVMGPASELGRF